jgi:hypothetical protein
MALPGEVFQKLRADFVSRHLLLLFFASLRNAGSSFKS